MVTRRYAKVHLKALDWTYYPESGVWRASITNRLIGNSGVYPKTVCSAAYNWVPTTASSALTSVADKSIGYVQSQSGTLFIKDSAYGSGDTDALKGALNGKYLVYALNTAGTAPDPNGYAPFADPQIVDDFGTEEYVDIGTDANRPVPVSAGHITEYKPNLRDKLQRIPDMPAADGRYVLAVSTDGTTGVTSYTWEATT